MQTVRINSILFFLLFLLHFVNSSEEHEIPDISHRTNKHTIHKMTPELSFEIKVHGFLLWASFGFLMPLGILAIRMSNWEQCERRLKTIFYIHACLQTLSVLLVTAGAIMSIVFFDNTFNNTHQKMGLTLYVAIWLQACVGFLRPHRGRRVRSVWFFVHWGLGTSVSVLGIINVYTGLQAYKKRTATSVRLWTVLFTVEISLIAFFYLFQDKWRYIQKQGVILGNEPVSPTDHEVFTKR